MTNEMLLGRKILITGASGGLGERFARLCVAAGAQVALAARRTNRLDAIVASLGEGRAIAIRMDVADEASVIAAYEAAEAFMGPLDGVVANAGIELSGPATDITVEDFDQVMAVNVRGAFLTAREGGRRMQKSGVAEKGRIVLISSITARITSPGITPYSISKAAVSHLGRMLAREWVRSGPNVNCISPGYIATDLVEEWFATEGGKKQIARFPRRRLMEPGSLDGALLFLLSDAASNTTGTDIVIDDGQTL